MTDTTRVPRICLVVALTAAWLSIAFHPVRAALATVKIVGPGAVTCAQFTNDAKQNPAVQRDYLAWAQGFMSAILLTRPSGVDDGLDLNPSTFPLLKQLEFLLNHCMQQPSADFSDAVEGLYKRLRKEGTT